MTKDEFINMPEDSRVRLTGDLEGRFGFESDLLFILKEPGDTDGALTTQERFGSFTDSLAHVFADEGIRRFRQTIGHVCDMELVTDHDGPGTDADQA
ncbi:MAG TPA: hypothetical protein ENH56_19315 [Roseobacter sp.]|uniref:Uncharacterized protein n=1 Tax=marine sediment metagenome TaxID=412755 RepID=A0A0F9JB79_9ZZZZ|nr:hypothetical protein [Roseobacter sp.]